MYHLKTLKDYQQSIATSTTIAYLNKTNCNSLPINLPPLTEQHEIVRQVDKLFSLADKLESHYQKAKARTDKLSQSVLAKAFRGELVPQDPNDEPAEKLLKRIMKEKKKIDSGASRRTGKRK
jgi:type I restriction enzyme S subunit